MKSIQIVLLIFGALLLSFFISCSKSSGTLTEPNISPSELPEISSNAESNRDVLAVYDAVIDPISKTFVITQSERFADYHFPLTQLYPNVLKIVDYGFTPNFWADIKLTHPFPGSGIDGFDPRIIAILPARTGVSFFYPIFNCIGNNSVVLEPDGYTKLFDNLGGAIPGNTNPFKAYFKDQPYRVWSSTGVTSETQRWNLNLAGFGGPMQFKLVVDVSTNYPNPPQPIVDNAPEPAKIETEIGDDLTEHGGSTEIYVTLLDWQGADGIRCKVEAPDLFSSAIQLSYSGPDSNPNEWIFSGMISNELLAPAGEYPILIAVWDINTDIHIFSEVIVWVGGDISFNPVDVTPTWPEYDPVDMHINGNRMYTSEWDSGINVFDISNPLNPVLLKTIETSANSTYCSNGYLYVAHGVLFIYDIEPLETVSLVKTVDIPGSASDIKVIGGYAYIAAGNASLVIVDIDPPESAFIAKLMNIDNSYVIDVSGDYAYITDSGGEFRIIDINPPESAYIVKSVFLNRYGSDIAVANGYAYIANSYNGLSIMDVDPPESAYIVKSVKSAFGEGERVYFSNGYAFVSIGNYGVMVVDVDPPESAFKTAEIGMSCGNSPRINGANGYAYSGDYECGIQILDIEPPESTSVISSIGMPGYSSSLCIKGDYAYVTDDNSGLSVIDVEIPESSKLVANLATLDNAINIYIMDNYAIVAAYGAGVQIFYIDPPNLLSLVKTIDTPGGACGVCSSGEYVFVADGEPGLQIIDIYPMDSAQIIKTIDTPGDAYGVDILNGYAYVADGDGGLQIMDIDPPESSYIVKEVALPDFARVVRVSNGYAFIANYESGLQIVDVDPINSAYTAKSVDTPSYAMGVCISGGYAYVADWSSGLQIIDIFPPESASIVGSFDTPGDASGVDISGNYAYIADYDTGIRIIKLW